MTQTKAPSASEQITSEVTSWPGVEAGPGRRGEFAFRVGRREIGHLHGDRFGPLLVPQADLARALRAGADRRPSRVPRPRGSGRAPDRESGRHRRRDRAAAAQLRAVHRTDARLDVAHHVRAEAEVDRYRSATHVQARGVVGDDRVPAVEIDVAKRHVQHLDCALIGRVREQRAIELELELILDLARWPVAQALEVIRLPGTTGSALRAGCAFEQAVGGLVGDPLVVLLEHLGEQWVLGCRPGEQGHRGAELHRVNAAEDLLRAGSGAAP